MAARVQPKKERDWRALADAHVRRGEMLTVWVCDDGGAYAPPPKSGQRGRPFTYSDALTEALYTIKVMLRLPLRAVEGFAKGLAQLAGASWSVPDYSTLSRRLAKLEVELSVPSLGGRRLLMVDSTGLKVFGEGEWKVRQHGTEGKRRTWRKVHLLVDRETGSIVAVETTERDVGDSLVLPALLPDKLNNNSYAMGDGAYHTKKLHREVHNRGGVLHSPPKRGARRWGKTATQNDEAAFVFRNQQVRAIGMLGRPEWKKKSGLTGRSFVESMMHRFKSLTGDRLASRTLERQKVEVRLRCRALNALSVSTWKPTAA